MTLLFGRFDGVDHKNFPKKNGRATFMFKIRLLNIYNPRLENRTIDISKFCRNMKILACKNTYLTQKLLKTLSWNSHNNRRENYIIIGDDQHTAESTIKLIKIRFKSHYGNIQFCCWYNHQRSNGTHRCKNSDI